MSIMDMLFAAAGGIEGAVQYWVSVLSDQNGYAAYGYGIRADANGGTYVIGSTSNGTYDSVLLVRYGPGGAIQWQRIFSVASGSASGAQVSTDASGNLYFTGTTGSTPAAVVTKCDASGVLQWQRVFGAGSSLYASVSTTDTTGNTYLVAVAQAGEQSATALVKYDTSGSLQWQRSMMPTSGIFNGNGVALDGSGGVYICGTARDTVGTGYEYLVLAKYNTSGVIQWQIKLSESSTHVSGSGIAIDSTGVYVCGSAFGSSTYMVLAKYDTSGTLQWQRKLENTSSDSPRISVDGSGGVYAVNKSYSESSDLCIAKYDTSGTLQYLRNLSSSTDDETGPVITADSGGNMFIACSATSPLTTSVLTMKLPTDGSMTGTYAPYTYSVLTLNESAGTLTSAAASIPSSTPSFTSTNGELVASVSSLVPTTIVVA